GATNGATVIEHPLTGAGGAATVLTLNAGVNIVGESLTLTSTSVGDLRTTLNGSGNAIWAGPITFSGDGNWNVHANGTIIFPGRPPAGNTSGPAGQMLIRGAGQGVISGVVNFGAGTIAKTDDGSWIITSTGNNWGTTVVSRGLLQLGATNALSITSPVQMGQA